jgi:hypothetical protein
VAAPIKAAHQVVRAQVAQAAVVAVEMVRHPELQERQIEAAAVAVPVTAAVQLAVQADRALLFCVIPIQRQ